MMQIELTEIEKVEIFPINNGEISVRAWGSTAHNTSIMLYKNGRALKHGSNQVEMVACFDDGDIMQVVAAIEKPKFGDWINFTIALSGHEARDQYSYSLKYNSQESLTYKITVSQTA